MQTTSSYNISVSSKNKKMIELLKKSTFSILLKVNESNVKHLGTGFFIGLDGLFFTVGHTFRLIEDEINNNGFKNLYIGFPSEKSKIYNILNLVYDSKDIFFQKGPTYKDTAIGIANFQNEEYMVFNRKRPKINRPLTVLGYHNTKSDKLHTLNNEYADLSMIIFENTSINIDSYDSLISYHEKDYRPPINRKQIFNNCVTFDRALNKGESGSPIVDNLGLVSGVFIGISKPIRKSNLILSKYCTKFIKYRTKFKYETYKDLDFRLKKIIY